MAGKGRKAWTRETLSAADLQDYVQDQVVMAFDSASQRTTLVPAPTEGMVSYLRDLDKYDRYTGTAWAPWANREGWRTYTPAGTTIANGGARQSGVGADPSITGWTSYFPERLNLVCQFRVGPSVAGTGAALVYVYVDGVVKGSGVKRTVDETCTIVASADLATVAVHSLSLRVEGFGGAVTWTDAQIIPLAGVAE